MAASRHTYIHTTSANAVTLVWGSLRLAPIKVVQVENLVCFLMLKVESRGGGSLFHICSVLQSNLLHTVPPQSKSLSFHFLFPSVGEKEPGNVGGFKPLTSGGSDRAPPIRLQNKITWMRDSLKAW